MEALVDVRALDEQEEAGVLHLAHQKTSQCMVAPFSSLLFLLLLLLPHPFLFPLLLPLLDLTLLTLLPLHLHLPLHAPP